MRNPLKLPRPLLNRAGFRTRRTLVRDIGLVTAPVVTALSSLPIGNHRPQMVSVAAIAMVGVITILGHLRGSGRDQTIQDLTRTDVLTPDRIQALALLVIHEGIASGRIHSEDLPNALKAAIIRPAPPGKA